MERSFWEARWREERIGFHQGTPNTFLTKYADLIDAKSHNRVLVPFCGKSRDMTWLADSGYHVVGAEWVEQAVRDFFEEQDIPYRVQGQRYLGGGVEIFAGDLFAFETRVDWIFDRAALIALRPADRRRYVDHLDRFLGDQGRVLLVTIEYPQEEMSGPPFSVSEAEIEALFGDSYQKRILEVCEGVERFPKGEAHGLSFFRELAWVLTKKRPSSGAGCP